MVRIINKQLSRYTNIEQSRTAVKAHSAAPGGTGGCYDKLRCHQRRQSRSHDNSRFCLNYTVERFMNYIIERLHYVAMDPVFSRENWTSFGHKPSISTRVYHEFYHPSIHPPSLSILRGCCPCPIWWVWQHQASSNTDSPTPPPHPHPHRIRNIECS